MEFFETFPNILLLFLRIFEEILEFFEIFSGYFLKILGLYFLDIWVTFWTIF